MYNVLYVLHTYRFYRYINANGMNKVNVLIYVK